MYLLTSNGLTSPQLIQYVESLSRKHHYKTACIIVTADHIYKEKNWHVPKTTQVFETMNLEVSLFDFDGDAPQELMMFDILFINGGNPYYLLKRINDTNSDAIFKDFAKDKLIIGMSAGSFIMQESIELVNLMSFEMNEWDIQDLKALGLVEIEVLPHVNKLQDRYPNYKEIYQQYEKDTGKKVHFLKDGEGIAIENNHKSYHLIKNEG